MSVKELRALCKERGIRGYSKLRKAELLDLLFSGETSVPEDENIRVAKLPHRMSGEPHPRFEEFLNFNVTSSSKDFCRELSPMFLGPVEHNELDREGVPLPVCKRFENFWQGCKVFECDLEEICEVEDLDISMLKDSYFERKRDIFNEDRGHRRALKFAGLPNSKTICSYYDGRFVKYLPARREIYIPGYMELARQTEAYDILSKVYNSGQKIVLLDYDGYEFEDIYKVMKNSSKPMGHGHVLYMMLKNLPIEEEL